MEKGLRRRNIRIRVAREEESRSLWGYSFLILLVRNERFCLDEVFYLLVMDEAARFMGFVRVLIPLDYVGL